MIGAGEVTGSRVGEDVIEGGELFIGAAEDSLDSKDSGLPFIVSPVRGFLSDPIPPAFTSTPVPCALLPAASAVRSITSDAAAISPLSVHLSLFPLHIPHEPLPLLPLILLPPPLR